MHHGLVIGQVVSIRTNAYGKRIATLRPIYTYDSKDQRQNVDQARELFPNRGMIFWQLSEEQVASGSLWRVQLEESFSYESANPERDRYRVAERSRPESLAEILGFGAPETLETARLLVERGLQLSYEPASYVYLRINTQQLVGPVRLVELAEHRWGLDAKTRLLPLPVVEPFALSELIESDWVEEHRTFVATSRKPGSITTVDWSTDEQVLKRVLEWVRANDRPYAEAARLTKDAIQQMIKQIAPANNGDSETVLQQQVRRASMFITSAVRRSEMLATFEQDLLALPSVKERLDRAERETRESYAERHCDELAALSQVIGQQERVLAEVEHQIKASEARALAEAQQQVEMRRAELHDLQRQIEERKAELSSHLERFESALGERLSHMEALPHRALAEVAVLLPLLGGGQANRLPAATTPLATSLPPLPEHLVQHTAIQITDLNMLKERTRGALRSRRINGQAAQSLLAAMLSGGMALVARDGGQEALEACASQMTGGRMLWLPVTPTAIEPADLLGRAHSETQHFAPHPGGLIDLLLHASRPEHAERLYLVVLDGVNRAAADAYLLPLLACYVRAGSDQPSLPLPVFHPASVLPHNPYLKAARLTWPSNVLLAGTLAEGSTTVPLPTSIWSYAALCLVKPLTKLSKSPRVEPAEVPTALWQAWRAKVCELEQDFSDDVLTDLLDSDSVRSGLGLTHFSHRLAVAAHLLGLSNADASQTAARGCIAPYALATGRVTDDDALFTNATDIKADDLKAIKDVLL